MDRGRQPRARRALHVAGRRALLDYFGRLCDQLTASHDESAGVCARARDGVRRALVAAAADPRSPARESVS